MRADHNQIMLPCPRVEKNDSCWVALLLTDAQGHTLSTCDAAKLGHHTNALKRAPVESHTAWNSEDKTQKSAVRLGQNQSLLKCRSTWFGEVDRAENS